MKRHLRFPLALVALAAFAQATAAIVIVTLPDRLPDIPHGHLPAPGECRVWVPGQPPGQQSQPGSCEGARHDVPLGGWLIYRATSDAVGISAYSVAVPYLVGDMRYYDAKSLEALDGPPAEVGAPRFEVPRGHLPPLGSCRIWWSSRPPGQQSPSVACDGTLGNVPAGARLLYRDSAESLIVTTFHPEIAGLLLDVRTVDVGP